LLVQKSLQLKKREFYREKTSRDLKRSRVFFPLSSIGMNKNDGAKLYKIKVMAAYFNISEDPFVPE
jgi:hypothetical protein